MPTTLRKRDAKRDGTASRMVQQGLLVAFLATTGCAQQYVAGPPPSVSDYNNRTACLWKQVGRFVQERGDSPLELNDIATLATGICSRVIWNKMIRQDPLSSYVLTDEHIDQIETERYALSIGMEIREQRRHPLPN